MKTFREIAIAQLRIDEGLRLQAYQCSKGRWTLGYGRNLEAKGIKPEIAKTMTCTKATAELWLAEDVDDAIRGSERFGLFRLLNDARKAVIVNMVFNMGTHRVSEFKKMWAAIGNNEFKIAEAEMLDSEWAREVGDRAKRLSKSMRLGS